MRIGQAQLVADGFCFLEAPKWRDGKIWMSDVFGRAVYTVTPEGKRELVCEIPLMPAGLGFMPDGRLIISSHGDRKLMQWKDGELSVYADLSAVIPYWINDFAIDANGRIYLGNYGYHYNKSEAPQPARMHRVDPDGSITEIATGMDFPNGAVIINGGRTLVVNETWVGRVTAFDLTTDGKLINRRVFAHLGERGPDGMCADASGAIWVGCYNSGEILRVLDGGEITDRFAFDGRAISCVVGGEDGRTLYMTAFLGANEEVALAKPKSALFSAKIDVGQPA
ncbi:SMP-30/gluconolactonase/LRE family protein [Paraburkholderia atlantica]|uniref:SMP-30/gluconolactonase/LRE family protein n=1 Tax=Paraburkholderia atlantica TaxID=2654982 RepID=UPI00160AED58|nr:SMP-30/gluconolactonase/LRE family protein [Paraburkholderia atlantica]MBB5415791.1 sugar lactone lactonase YvrE [Paraburkholderia atlantica]